jgi:hypothetical protein
MAKHNSMVHGLENIAIVCRLWFTSKRQSGQPRLYVVRARATAGAYVQFPRRESMLKPFSHDMVGKDTASSRGMRASGRLWQEADGGNQFYNAQYRQ